MIVLVVALAAFVVGLAVESHWCGHRHQALRQQNRANVSVRAAERYLSAAKHWHRMYTREKKTSEGHAAMLAALGRAVSEGGSISEREGQ